VEAKRTSSSSSIGDELSLSLSGSSSFFKRSRHNYYYTQPPHDTKLYDTLGIPPNATLLDVQKAHRKRSLLYHPDKIPPSQASEAKHKLDKISHAYAILNNDQSRLLYHRYGIIDGNEEYILRLLLLGNNAAGNYDQGGRGGDASSLSSSHSSSVIGVDDDEIMKRRQQQFRLLELMGYPSQHHNREGYLDQQQQYQHRKNYLVGTITERLRPMVEGTISQEMFINDIYQECNTLKSCPFGATNITLYWSGISN
jgi:curved DNA-binding protein CbpA